MIWEVDEDHDGKVGWEEFQRAYERCSNDIHGTEPRQLYNVVLFLLHTTSAVTVTEVGEEGKSSGARSTSKGKSRIKVTKSIY